MNCVLPRTCIIAQPLGQLMVVGMCLCCMCAAIAHVEGMSCLDVLVIDSNADMSARAGLCTAPAVRASSLAHFMQLRCFVLKRHLPL